MSQENLKYDRHLQLDADNARERTIESWDGSTGDKNPDSIKDFSNGQRTHQKETWGRNIPNFHKKVKAGVLLPLTDFMQFEQTGSQAFSYDLSYSLNYYRQRTDWTPFGSVAPVTWDEVTNKIGALNQHQYFVQAAAAKIYSRGWDSLTFLAELKLTVKMFRKALADLFNLLRHFKEYIRSLKSWDLELANRWLEGRYGWRILQFEIEAIQQLMEDLDEEDRTRFKESIGTNVDVVEEYTVNHGLGGAGSVDLAFTDTYTLGIRGTVVADVSPPDWFINPVMTGWEVTKLSFVFDWIVNVGQWIEAMSFLVLSTQHYAAGGYRVQCNRNVVVDTVFPATDWNLTVNGSASFETVWTKRIPASLSLNPLVQLRLDDFKVMDLVFLIHQAWQGYMGEAPRLPRDNKRRKGSGPWLGGTD